MYSLSCFHISLKNLYKFGHEHDLPLLHTASIGWFSGQVIGGQTERLEMLILPGPL